MIAQVLQEFGVTNINQLNDCVKFKEYIKTVELFNNNKVTNFFFMNDRFYLVFPSSIVGVAYTSVGLTLVSETAIHEIK